MEPVYDCPMKRRDTSSRPLPTNISADDLESCLITTTLFVRYMIQEGTPFVNALNTEPKITRAGKVLMALGNITSSKDWAIVKVSNVTTKSIIHWINHVFGESINPGGYDSIRRDILRPLLLIGIVKQPEDMARNNPTRGFYLSEDAVSYMQTIHSKGTRRTIKKAAQQFASQCKQVNDQCIVNRCEYSFENAMNVHIGEGQEIWLESGGHNLLQKAVIELFLPTFDPEFRVLYLGDAKDRYILYDVRILGLLGVGDLTKSQKLPDVLVWCPTREKLLVIEAVHSSGAITDMRVAELTQLFENVSVDIEYLTVFKDRPMFKRFSTCIAWRSAVWLADEPQGVIRYEPMVPILGKSEIDCLMDY